MICIKICVMCIDVDKDDDNIHENGIGHVFNRIVKHVFASMNACYQYHQTIFFNIEP